jgi:hypothetical protein
LTDLNPFSRPAKLDDPLGKAILQLGTFLMMPDLTRRRLPHIDISQLGPVRGCDPILNRQ